MTPFIIVRVTVSVTATRRIPDVGVRTGPAGPAGCVALKAVRVPRAPGSHRTDTQNNVYSRPKP